MRLLVDTHTLIWVMNNHDRLGPSARAAILSPLNQIFISVASIWEASIKFRAGKFPSAATLLDNPRKVLDSLSMEPLPISLEHARLAGLLAHSYKDPFDRMLAAQAILEGLTLGSIDSVFDDLPVPRLW
ncbi:MAG: type II toxin-antitoxin system VapC family toxin [Terracidiphilus sp.]|jgi:PIN domain nuclease of toxin-antitoxin system